jgi:hypothetical protein
MLRPDPPPSDEEDEASSPDADADRESDDDEDEPEDLDLATASGDGAASLVGWARACSSSPSANGWGGLANVRWRRTSASVGAPCEELGESDMVKAASAPRPLP